MTAYYNEFDPRAAAWLRELIKQNLIAPGEVDERSIEDVTPNDLRGFTQVHFFAGIGVWSHALRQAGWRDDQEVWTGSCPCQPFSAAGEGKGFADDRHLWPAFYWLIQKCKPSVVFGEQVASRDGITWLDTVSADLEREGYAFGPMVLPACGFGAPHKRDRTFFVAVSGSERLEGVGLHLQSGQSRSTGAEALGGRAIGDLADTMRSGWSERRTESGDRSSSGSGCADGLGDSENSGLLSGKHFDGPGENDETQGRGPLHGRDFTARGTGPTNNFWRNADWLYCTDEKFRPVEPGTFPLAHGAPARMGRLRGYGNAIVAPVAIEFIKAAKEVIGFSHSDESGSGR